MTPSNDSDRLSQASTDWTLLRQVHAGAEAESRAAIELLLLRYRGAVYRYLRKAVGEATAEDLTQEFALALLHGKFRHADPYKGRFRDYVRTALFNLVAKHRRQEKRPHVAPRAEPESPDSAAEAGRLFDEAWRDELLSRVWATLRDVQQSWYDVLRFRAENPDLPSPKLATALGERLGRSMTADGVRQLLHRARDKFADLLLDELRHSLDDPSEDNLLEELSALGLLDYCRTALTRRRA